MPFYGFHETIFVVQLRIINNNQLNNKQKFEY